MVGRLNPNWIGPTAPRGTSDNRFATTAFVTGGGAGPRIVLNATTTFFIANNGSDANDGLASTRPWLTPAHAFSVIDGQYDFGGQAVTLQAVSGHAAFTSTFNPSPWVGGGSFVLDLNGGSVTVTGGDAIFMVGQPPGVLTIQNGTLSTVTSGVCLHNQMGGLTQFQSLTFGACAAQHILVNGGGCRFICTGNYSITGGATTHAQANPTCVVGIEGSLTPNLTVTLTGTPNFGVAFGMAAGGDLFVDQTTWSGNATGRRYLAQLNGLIYTANGGANYLPGDAAGTTLNPGFYI